MCDVSAHVDYEDCMAFDKDLEAIRLENEIEEVVDYLIAVPRWRIKIILWLFPKFSKVVDIYIEHFCWKDLDERLEHIERVKRYRRYQEGGKK